MLAAAAVDPSYVASDTKRFRRTKSTMDLIRAGIIDVLQEDRPQTVRQVYYALTARHLIDKNETEYQRTVVRLLTQMREDGLISFDWIADNTRWMRKPYRAAYGSGEACSLARSGNVRA
jgi:hypothetical protein